jgi:hypothetical protein
MKNIYEVFDEFEIAKNKAERMKVIERNLSKALVEVLKLTFDPAFDWHIKELPHDYQLPLDNQIPGMSRVQLSTEIRKLYLFRKGDGTSDNLNPRKREELLLRLLESLEPREAEVVIGIFNKDLGVRGLDYKFVKEAFPDLLP